MAGALVWDQIGQKKYETGVEQAALFLQDSTGAYTKGEAWNGLTKFTESPSGAEATSLYANDSKYLDLISVEKYGATLEAYTYPDGFGVCIGDVEITKGVSIGQQDHKTFGLAYKTLIGNDVDKNNHGYKLHLVYGCTAAPSQQDHESTNDTPAASTMSWTISTTPVPVKNNKPTATVVIDSTKIDKAKLEAIDKVIYGSAEADARLPLPDELLTILEGVG